MEANMKTPNYQLDINLYSFEKSRIWKDNNIGNIGLDTGADLQ